MKYWSSSWWWQPHIGVCRLFWPLLRAGMAVLTQFFCKMYFLCVSQSRKKKLGNFFLVLPPERAVFSRRGSLAVQISREVVLPAQEPPLWKSAAQHFWWAEHRLWSSVWLSRFSERWFCWQRNHLSGKAEPPLWKSDVASEKRSPWPPKKLKWGPQKKAFPRFHLKMYFLQKTASKLVKFGLCSSISDLHTPIGGPHPMLYFPSQIQRNIVLCYARWGTHTHYPFQCSHKT